MTVNVPADNAERVGLRKVIDEEAVKKVVKYLTSGGTEMPKNWNRRFKHNRDKMKTGDIFELAEVVRNLSLRDGEKGLSTGEKQMYVKAKKILASELMYAKNLSEDDAFAWLEGVLTGGDRSGASVRRRSGRSRRSRSGQAEDTGRRVDVSVWAVLVAAGRGERLGEDRPKAFARLGGLPLLAEPLRRLDESEWIDGDRRRRARRLGGAGDPASPRSSARRRSPPASRAGATRSASVRLGLAEVPDDADVVLVHDAARPLLPPELVPRLLEALAEGFDGAVPGVPVADTVKRVRDGVVVETPPRDELVAVQTPQAFVASVLRAAAAGEGSDCASLVEAAGGRVKVVPGDERLLKVTTPADLRRVEAWLAAEQ